MTSVQDPLQIKFSLQFDKWQIERAEIIETTIKNTNFEEKGHLRNLFFFNALCFPFFLKATGTRQPSAVFTLEAIIRLWVYACVLDSTNVLPLLGNEAIFKKIYRFISSLLVSQKRLETEVQKGQYMATLANGIGGNKYGSLGDYKKEIEFQRQSLSIAKEIGNKKVQHRRTGYFLPGGR